MNVDHNKVDVLYMKLKWKEIWKTNSFDIIFVYIEKKKSKEILLGLCQAPRGKFASKNAVLTVNLWWFNVFWHIKKKKGQNLRN